MATLSAPRSFALPQISFRVTLRVQLAVNPGWLAPGYILLALLWVLVLFAHNTAGYTQLALIDFGILVAGAIGSCVVATFMDVTREE